MSDKEEEAPEKPFYVDRAKTGRACCKKCKQKIGQGELRFAKLGHNPFGSGTMKMWHHIPCIFEVFKKQRATTKKIDGPDDIDGWFDISEEDQKEIQSYFSPELKEIFDKCKMSKSPGKVSSKETQKSSEKKVSEKKVNENHKDMSFRTFRKLCADVAEAPSYNSKTAIVKEFLTNGSSGTGFKGDVVLWCRLLLPGVLKRNYNLQSKQLIKIFSRILNAKQEEMLEDLEKGDVAETIAKFFDQSGCHSSVKSTLTLSEVDDFLKSLSLMTKENEQASHFMHILEKCTTNDVKMLIRLVKHDLRINAGAKHILQALHPDAYKAFQTSRDINAVIEDALKANIKRSEDEVEEKSKGMSINLKLMTPVLPMLAQVCRSVKMALKKCPNGMFSEVKYDGERVQLHKEGNNFKYFSRSLKPVLSHKVSHFKDYIPNAFMHAADLILDAEMLMVDNTGKPLPFGSLGIHKKNSFKDANVCLFVFDCLYINGECLINRPIKERREILKKNMVEIKNHIMFSDIEEIHRAEDLESMITKVFRLGLEGLVLKDLNSVYEPGKRHWLKIKKDYLCEGAMADSADLVVLGAWFGTGNKGGIMSSFLMGCYDESTKTWRTVTKVHSGHDEATLEKLQSELEMVKIGKDASKVPEWLRCTRTMIPDFVAKNPVNMPVWKITGAEFTRNQVHTADGISIRFPRVASIRHDKDWSTATSLLELKNLYELSKDTADFTLKDSEKISEDADDENGENTATPKKEKSNNGSPPSKKRKLDDTDDTDTDEDRQSEKSSDNNAIANPLPDVFTGCVIQMPPNYKENDFLRRYLIAYGAVLYDKSRNTNLENSKQKVTHVVHVRKKSARTKEDYWADSVRHIHINWIWDSIKLLQRQNEKKYAVNCV